MSVVSVKAIVNEVEIDLVQNDATGLWEAESVAPAKSSYTLDGHYYGVTLIATNDAGNEATIDATDTEFGEALQLVVQETVAPEITIIAPTEGEVTGASSPVIEFTVTDDDSGVDKDTIKMAIDGNEATGLTIIETDDGYAVSYTAEELEDGEHVITVNASDHDGNAAEEVSVTFIVAAAVPELSITSPDEDACLDDAEVLVSGTTNGATITVQINDGEPIIVEVVDGEFSQTFELNEGQNTIIITATSESGVTTTFTRTVTVDTLAPIFKSVIITPNPMTCGNTFTISVEVADE